MMKTMHPKTRSVLDDLVHTVITSPGKVVAICVCPEIRKRAMRESELTSHIYPGMADPRFIWRVCVYTALLGSIRGRV